MQSHPRKKIVFSGIQPSGILHIGNYLGAIRQWVSNQSEKENYFCVVDMHAITTPKNPESIRQLALSTAALYLAAGIDPEMSTVFVQSHVSAHAECCWILNCVTPIGWLERMTQYKSKVSEQVSVSTGLLDYPVLQAADILLYDANEVPVGEDQKQHVELSRDIAQRFNHIYGETFTIPEPVLPSSGARIRALNDPMRKMSKSESDVRGHAVLLTDEPDEIRRTFRRAVTDSGKEIKFSNDLERAGVNNLLEIYQLFSGHSKSDIEAHFEGKGYGSLKEQVAEVVIEALRPIREQYHRLLSDPIEINQILADGAARAAAVSGSKLAEIQYKVGFIPRSGG
jgi:tryptophanyl-tRNA synthetase